MLAAEVPADIHELHRVEGTAAAPRPGGGVRALSLKAEDDRDGPGPRRIAPGGPEIRADVREQHDVGVLEVARAHEKRLAA